MRMWRTLALALAVLVVSAGAAAAQARVAVGVLECRSAGTTTFIVGSVRAFDLRYRR